jgi:hypothetical protein
MSGTSGLSTSAHRQVSSRHLSTLHASLRTTSCHPVAHAGVGTAYLLHKQGLRRRASSVCRSQSKKTTQQVEVLVSVLSEGDGAPSGKGSAADIDDVEEKVRSPVKRRGRPRKSRATNDNGDGAGQRASSSASAGSFSSLVKEFFDSQSSGDVESESSDKELKEGPTELIFKLSRRGYGWGEEIIPHLTVEKRPVKGPASVKRKKTSEMKVKNDLENTVDAEASPETVLNAYLIGIGVPEQEVDRLVNSAVAWRMTPGGRPLIDRRRQSRLTRNVKIVTKYLVDKCGVPLGEDGVAAVFMRTPELMLCKPSNNDRWDRRAVELAAFLLKNGHCNVPEIYPENQELGMWVKRQRVTRAAGQLSQERLTILERMGFEFGDLAQVTEEWETRFDMLVDWVLWHGESGETFSWDLINWGKKGGITARELALWISLQREFYRRQLLPAEAVQRFEAVYSGWRDAGNSVEEERWMSWLGRLVYVIERRRLSMRRPPTGRGNPFASQKNPKSVSKRVDEAEGGDSRASMARKQVVNTVSSRREAAAASPFSEDPGLRYWLSRQRWMWRKAKLDPERVKMLQLAGIDMDIYPADDWRRSAHMAAEHLQGSRIEIPFVGNASSCDDKMIGGEHPAYVASRGSARMQVLRWVETQRALFLDGRLSPGQLRYMTFLGLTWVLSDEVVDPDDSVWISKWKLLKEQLSSEGALPYDLHDWVVQQRALCFLSLLDEPRQAKLASIGISLDIEQPSNEEHEWNARISQLFIHTQELGHADVSEAKEPYPGLFEWLERCKSRHKEECLSPGKVAQLKSLGVKFI